MIDLKHALTSAAPAAIAGLAAVIGAAAIFANAIRERVVYSARESGAESAIHQVAERERAIQKSTGDFVTFGNKDVESNNALLGIFWDRLPTKDFTFDAVKLNSGNVRLRALPRPDSVNALAVRARLYVVELKPDGAVVRDGWLPTSN